MRYELIAPRDESLSAVEQILLNRGIKIEDIENDEFEELSVEGDESYE